MVKIILPNKKCFLSPGLALLRTQAGGMTISWNTVRSDSQQMFTQGLPDWSSPREVTLLAPLRIQPAYAHIWGQRPLFVLQNKFICFSPSDPQIVASCGDDQGLSVLHDPGWMHLAVTLRKLS